MIVAELLTASILGVSLYLSIKHYDKVEDIMNKIFK